MRNRHLWLFVVAGLVTALALLTLAVSTPPSAAQTSPGFVEALEKGEMLMAQGKHQAAIRSLKKAEKLSREPSWQVLLHLAVCFNRIGKFDRSEDYARAAVEVAEDGSEEASAFYMLGLSLDPGVEAEAAETAFRKVLEIIGGHANMARYRLGEVLKRQGRHQEAYAVFSEYLERQPDGELSAEARSAMDSLACRLPWPWPPAPQPAVANPISSEDGANDPLLRVGGDVKPPKKLHAPNPQYTEIARKARIQGVVILQAIIDKNGDLRSVKILKDLEMGLGEAAADAACRWKFEPATLNGKPVAVIYNMTTNFRLK